MINYPIVHLYSTFREAKNDSLDFLCSDSRYVDRKMICGNYFSVEDKTCGNLHFFMSEEVYRKFCLGRIYILDGVLYRSGRMLPKHWNKEDNK